MSFATITMYLGVSESAFIANETELVPDRKSFMRNSRSDGLCIYLTKDNLCTINPFKLEKCRTFPPVRVVEP